MENNQEHKIDKIFKKLLENQSVVPPADAWIAIHTYTIGQEKSKKRVLLRYASLTLLLLLFSGLGLWYYVENQASKELFVNTRTTIKKNKELSVKTHITTDNNNASQSSLRKHTTVSKIKKSTNLNREFRNLNSNNSPSLSSLSHELLVENTNNGRKVNLKRPIEREPLIIEIEDDSTMYGKEEFVYPVAICYPIGLSDLETIKPKPLFLNNLSDKIQKESEQKVVALEENLVDKKEISKTDSIDYGSKFSLKHPILSLAVGSSKINWKMTEDRYSQNLYDETTNCQSINMGIAWKLTRKTRLGLKLALNKINDIKIGFGSTLQKNATGTSYLTLNIINSNVFYKTETPFGDVNVPINLLKDWGLLSKFPILYDNTSYVYYFPQSMQTFQCDIVLENDLFSRKRKSQYLYQFYFLTDINIQRQISYNYLVDRMLSDLTPENRFPTVSLKLNHLQNASEIVLGLRAGLGFRYQFTRKWDFYVEGSGQHSLNNWLKSDNIKTFQRILSLQAGINLNL